MEAPVIWFHAPDGARLGAVEELARRLLGEFPAAELVITGDVAAAQRKDPLDIRLIDRSGESRSDILAFLRDVTPSVLLWVGGSLHGTLLSEVEAAGLPRFLIDARQSDFEESRLPWKRMRQKGMLRRFERILAVDERAAAALAAQGARPGTVEIAGAVEESGAALPHSEADRADLAEALATRPVWYAVDVPLEEFSSVLKGHAAALSRAHRFLLIAQPKDEGDGRALLEKAQKAHLRAALRSQTDEIDTELQVLIADVPGEDGLWYRLAPIAYLGGTLTGSPSRNPFEAAALGSAVLHGKAVSVHGSNIQRLDAAGAAAVLAGPADLAPQLIALSAPDRSAELAHGAWEVSSRGADVTDRIVSLLRGALRPRTGSH